jgi:hypothetical protein
MSRVPWHLFQDRQHEAHHAPVAVAAVALALGTPATRAGCLLAIALALFVAALSLQVEFVGGIDIRHSVEPQDLRDGGAPLLFAPVSGNEHNGLPRGILYINQIATDACLRHAKNYVLSA